MLVQLQVYIKKDINSISYTVLYIVVKDYSPNKVYYYYTYTIYTLLTALDGVCPANTFNTLSATIFAIFL